MFYSVDKHSVMYAVNEMKTKVNLSYDRKSMIICGLDKDINSTWKFGKL